MWITHGEEGQASVELVALLPLLLAVILVFFQLVLVGASAWLASTAARDAARASALGTDPRAAASSSLPSAFRHGLSVSTTGSGVRIRLPIPTLTGIDLGSLSATASMEPQR
jgi:Flp pilus assembly protein TadG